MRPLLILLLPLAASAAIFPEYQGPLHRTSVEPAPVADQALWKEYGLQASEKAGYVTKDGQAFQETAYRFQDATGALAAFESEVPADAKPSNLSRFAAASGEQLHLVLGNYLVIIENRVPDAAELNILAASLPRYEPGPFPSLPQYLPDGVKPNSERYIVGPVSLKRFVPSISAATVGFHLGAEGQIAKFETKSVAASLAIFSYPTSEIARDRQAQLEKLPNSLVKRTGPLVAAVLDSSDPNESERLLSQIKYQASVTLPQHVPTKKDNVGNFMVNLFILIGILLVFCALSGLAVGGLRMILRRGGADGEGGQVISLHIREP